MGKTLWTKHETLGAKTMAWGVRRSHWDTSIPCRNLNVGRQKIQAKNLTSTARKRLELLKLGPPYIRG